ncbi:unnamed protein product [Trifolium pratense]|uniref:Uncharacterized protein n=1 Tax=Trifolium pratense TaxID=57577 RepID=A0ACB0LG70_TRIPR|nr:unnamed protein product [Trifolium pratense]
MAKIPSEFPLFLGVGGQDILSDVQDVNLLLNDLNNHDPNKLVELIKEDYAHLDFGVDVNAKQVIYDPMIAFFKAHWFQNNYFVFNGEDYAHLDFGVDVDAKQVIYDPIIAFFNAY